jgi:hypothetical protein
MPTDFNRMKPEAILKTEAINKHNAEMAYFHNKLSELNHSTYFMDRIIAFPLDLFVHPAEDLFLRMVLDYFAQVAVLQITKLTTDNGRDAHTSGRLKTFIDSAVKAELQEHYRQVLKDAKFKPRIRDLIDKAKSLRNTQIAHSIAPQPGDKMAFITLGLKREGVVKQTEYTVNVRLEPFQNRKVIVDPETG